MWGHTDGIDVETKTEVRLLKSLPQSLLGGESFFMNTLTAPAEASLQLVPSPSGDIKHHRLEDETLFVQSTSSLASESDVEVDTAPAMGVLPSSYTNP